MNIKYDKPRLAKLIDGIKHQGIGGRYIVLEREGTIDTAKELVVLAVVKGVVERRGAWYFYNGVQVAQGQDNLIQKLREDREMFLEIVGKL